jgi:hypothetical protein
MRDGRPGRVKMSSYLSCCKVFLREKLKDLPSGRVGQRFECSVQNVITFN